MFAYTPVDILRNLLADTSSVKDIVTNLYHNNSQLLQRLHDEVNRERERVILRIEPVMNRIKEFLKVYNPEATAEIDKLSYDNREAAMEVFIKCEASLNEHVDEFKLLGQPLDPLIFKFEELDELRDKMNGIINKLAENDNSHLLDNIRSNKSNESCSGGRTFNPLPRNIS